jgi:hypothetical protein
MMARGTISVSSFVKIDTSNNNSVLEAGANAKCFGISQTGGANAPIPSVADDPVTAASDGQTLQVHAVGACTNLLIGTGGCTAGDYLKSDAAGSGVTVDGTEGLNENVGAIALETASAGELAQVQVHIFISQVDAT